MLTFGAIADYFKPAWIVWENVPGVLSSNGGRDFGSFLGMLGELGYGFAYRVLDAQFYGVAQRRRRVFVVGYFGDWRRAAQVLFESESLCGYPPPSREAREGVAGNAQGSSCQGLSVGEITPTLDKSKTPAVYDMRGNGDGETVPTITGDHASRPTDYTPIIMSTGHTNAEITNGYAPTLTAHAKHEAPILSYGIPGNWIGKKPENGGNAVEPMKDVAPCLTKTDRHGVAYSTVRRLTPRECERLQGFPDDWTKIPWRGKPAEDCPDGNRYKACGNSMAVPVMRWMGERINTYSI